jgi:general secretion pathway protein D
MPSSHTIRAWSRVVFVLAAIVIVTACAAATAKRNALRAEQRQDYDRAIVEYTRALQANPNDVAARTGLERAKVRAAETHFVRGRRQIGLANYEEALVELQLASELNPASRDVAEALREAQTRLSAEIVLRREGETPLESIINSSRETSTGGLDLPGAQALPDSLTFRDASSRDVFVSLGRFAGINVIFDPAFSDAVVSVDLQDASIDDALGAVASSTGNFVEMTAPGTVTIIPDTPAKRREYQREVVRTFYLSNVDLQEAIDLLRIVIDARRVAPISATNAITIKDTPEKVAAAGRVLQAIDKARAEVVIDVELLEVDRTELLEYGLQFASSGSDGIDGQLDVNQQGLTLSDLTNLTQSNIFVTSVPGLFYRLLKNDSSTRTLANPHLRTSEGVAAQARFGERVPVPVTTFAPIATGGVAQQPITSFNYENIGVNIDITPRTHHDDDVSLALQIEISNISGVGFGNLPTFGNRSIDTTIRLHDGETNMLAGLIRDDEREVLAGIPGLSDLPVVGRLFARSRREAQQTDIVLMLTPRIIRVLELTESDLQPFQVEAETGSAPILNLPAIGIPPRDGAGVPDEEDEEPPAAGLTDPGAPILLPRPGIPPQD